MVDILMATYNGEKYIKEQILSILAQTYADYRIVIHDDGSTDDTVNIIKELQAKNPDKIVYIDDGIATGGAKNNFYHLFKFSDADYIMFADQDDVWKENKIENAVRCMESQDDINDDIPIMGYSDLIVVDEKLDIINASLFDMQSLDGQKNSFNNILVQNIVTGCTVIFNRKTLQMCKEMPQGAIMHDWWMALIASSFGRLFYMDNKDILYRQHSNNTEGAKNCKNPIYLMKKMFNPKQIRQALINTRIQAKAFKEVFGKQLSEKNKEILDKYISLDSVGKLKKLKIIKDYDFEKNGFIKKLVQKIMI